jgi:hypothetical protein
MLAWLAFRLCPRGPWGAIGEQGKLGWRGHSSASSEAREAEAPAIGHTRRLCPPYGVTPIFSDGADEDAAASAYALSELPCRRASAWA